MYKNLERKVDKQKQRLDAQEVAMAEIAKTVASKKMKTVVSKAVKVSSTLFQFRK